MTDLQMRRLGVIMEPESGNPMEAEGVLNPAAVRGPDGNLYLFPRIVAKGNYSRIGIARVVFSKCGDPCGVERLGIAMEPEMDFELHPGGGGCEDPRISFVEPLGHYVMNYTASTPNGPRLALAVSDDLFRWRRLGLATFLPSNGIEIDGVDDKDACIFPVAIPDRSGQPALALLHRPLFPGTRAEEKAGGSAKGVSDARRPSIWISFRDMEIKDGNPSHLCHFTSHNQLAAPAAAWELIKIGCGAPPVLTRHGWLVIYHGVSEITAQSAARPHLCYSAGLMLLSAANPLTIRYRSPEPILTPETQQERYGRVPNVVFPTGIDRRHDLGLPDRFDVYYGMADNRIGVARLDLPEHLGPSCTRPIT